MLWVAHTSRRALAMCLSLHRRSLPVCTIIGPRSILPNLCVLCDVRGGQSCTCSSRTEGAATLPKSGRPLSTQLLLVCFHAGCPTSL